MQTLKPIIHFLTAFLVLGSFSCSNSGKQDRPDDDRAGHPPSLNQPRDDYGASTDWNEFIKEAGSDGLKEVQMAGIALNKSQSDQVRDLAEMIRQDHQNANTQLQEIANRNGEEVPEEMLNKHKTKVNELSNVPPEQFDQRYVKMMVEGHQKAISKFEAALTNGQNSSMKGADTAPSAEDGTTEDNLDSQIKNWIRNTLPVLKKHRQQSEELQSQLTSGENI